MIVLHFLDNCVGSGKGGRAGKGAATHCVFVRWGNPLCSTLFRAISQMSVAESFHSLLAVLYSSIRGS